LKAEKTVTKNAEQKKIPTTDIMAIILITLRFFFEKKYLNAMLNESLICN